MNKHKSKDRSSVRPRFTDEYKGILGKVAFFLLKMKVKKIKRSLQNYTPLNVGKNR